MRAEIRGEKGGEANMSRGDMDRQRLERVDIMKNRSEMDISLLASTYTNTFSLASNFPPLMADKNQV
jgi:hypothetical protein